jgi:hypothetical protein
MNNIPSLSSSVVGGCMVVSGERTNEGEEIDRGEIGDK